MRPADKRSFQHELDSYSKIKAASIDVSLRISRLLGLVRDQQGLVSGLLLTYIDCGRVTLSCAVKPLTPPDLRQKWVEQLQHIVQQLHHLGVVWGDAKPDNILIDRNKHLWVVDFGGGYTEGWVPKEYANTQKGDLIALDKLVAFIETGD